MTLIKSMLSSILTYFMSLGTMPTHVAHKLEKLQNDSYGEALVIPKFYLVDWSVVCSPIKGGALSIKKLSSLIQSLLGKWLWKFGVERYHIWRRFIYENYGEGWGGCSTEQIRGCTCS